MSLKEKRKKKVRSSQLLLQKNKKDLRKKKMRKRELQKKRELQMRKRD